MLNEKKYQIESAINRDDNKEIPDDEPVFLIRAKDNLSIQTLKFYVSKLKPGSMKDNLAYVISKFEVWRYENQNKCKEPD